MRTTKIFANLRVADIESAKGFYAGYLGLSNEEFNMGWVARCSSPDTEASVQLVTRDLTAAEDSVISVCTDDIDGAYAEAHGLRNRPPAALRSVRPAAIPCAGTGRKCHQHREPSALTSVPEKGPKKSRR